MADMHIKDISQHQDKPARKHKPAFTPDIKGHVEADHPALIIRAYNGHRADHRFVRNRRLAQQAGVVELGIYAYIETVQRKDKHGNLLPAPLPIEQQAHEFLDLVGDWAPNEFPMIDLEEGTGSQLERATTWLSIVEAVTLPTVAVIYSGLDFAKNHGLKEVFKARPGIVAAYRTSPEPHQSEMPHSLWQHSDGSVPEAHVDHHLGAVDCSIFHGTIDELSALVHPEQAMGLTGLEEDVKLDKDDLAAIADIVAKGVGRSVLTARFPDPLAGDQTDTSVQTTLRSLRRQVEALTKRSASDIAAAVVAALPHSADAQVTAADVENALRTVLVDVPADPAPVADPPG